MSRLGRHDADANRAMSARLVRLREAYDSPFDDAPEATPSEAPPPPPPRDAELVFTVGPRAGTHVLVEGRAVSLDRDGNESAGEGGVSVVARVWTQGDQIMLRQSGAILVGGGRPALPVVVLEDGDELAWGSHRLQFRRAPAVGR
jgi:hypothetical protein